MTDLPVPSPDPQKSLNAASISATLAGWVCLIIGVVSISVIKISDVRFLYRFGFEIFVAGVAVFYVVPGLVYLWLAAKVLARRKWAIIMLLAMGSLHGGLFCVATMLGFRQGLNLEVGMGVGMSVLFVVMIIYAAQSLKIPVLPAVPPDPAEVRRTRIRSTSRALIVVSLCLLGMEAREVGLALKHDLLERPTSDNVGFAISSAFTFFIPAVLFFICALGIWKHRRGWLTTGWVCAGVHSLIAVGALCIALAKDETHPFLFVLPIFLLSMDLALAIYLIRARKPLIEERTAMQTWREARDITGMFGMRRETFTAARGQRKALNGGLGRPSRN